MKQLETHKSFGGQQLRFSHRAETLNCEMTFSIYLPPQADMHSVPVLYWLSGLTCTDENFVFKAGAQQYAAEYGIAIVAADTSPRGLDFNGQKVPDDPKEDILLGWGAGFYMNATEEPWAANYQMYDYITQELPALINAKFPVDSNRVSIFGHSMGGHGALTIGMKNPDVYRSISALAPLCSPINCEWGQHALNNYIGDNRANWESYDACSLIGKAQKQLPVKVDQGAEDEFLADTLKTELLIAASEKADYPMDIRMHADYDHSYFFVATFIGEHIRFHAKYL